MKNSGLLLVFIILLLLGCYNTKKTCLNSYTEYKGLSYSPNLSIVKEKASEKSCIYHIYYSLCIRNQLQLGNGILKKVNKEYYLSLDTANFRYFKIFDLSINIGDEFNSSIPSYKESDESQEYLKIKLINKFLVSDEFIYCFRLFDSYCADDSIYDQIFFVKQNSGVVGSYVSRYDDSGDEWIYAPRGQIFKNRLDYSKKIFGKIL